jgi:DNA-binding CsgD family transcriptional regulator/PAS domain-containing protein
LDELVALVDRSPLPAVILELPSERIVAASDAAAELLTGGAESPVGRHLEEFLGDRPSGGLDLMRAGRISGYETKRTVERTGQPLQVWVRAVDAAERVTYALAVLISAEDRAVPLFPAVRDGDVPLVLGTTDAALHVERISSDVETLLDLSPEHLVGRSILTLIDPGDAATMLLAVAEATQTGRGVTFSARCRVRGDGEPQPADAAEDSFCQLLVVPLEPAPSVGFMVLPGDGLIRSDSGASHGHLQDLMRKFALTIDAAATSRVTSAFRRSARPRRPLSSRELEIVGRLVAGDRVPAIAKALFVSQSTVRNHLSAVFSKFGVGSQQELIDLLRETDGPSTRK